MESYDIEEVLMNAYALFRANNNQYCFRFPLFYLRRFREGLCAKIKTHLGEYDKIYSDVYSLQYIEINLS